MACDFGNESILPSFPNHHPFSTTQKIRLLKFSKTVLFEVNDLSETLGF